MCGRHGVLSLISRVLEHDTLVNSGVKVILNDGHTTCKVKALFVDVEQYLSILINQSLSTLLISSTIRASSTALLFASVANSARYR